MRQLIIGSLLDVAFDYPIMLDLTGVPVLVVGGGRVALRKIEGLLKAGADVTVVAPNRRSTSIRSMPSSRCRDDVRSRATSTRVRLVITATDDPAVNAAVAADATAGGIWVNSADDPANCTFILPAVARDGDVTVAVGTGGASPALASHLRGEIESVARRDRCRPSAASDARRAAQRDAAAAAISTESIDWSDSSAAPRCARPSRTRLERFGPRAGAVRHSGRCEAGRSVALADHG